VIASLGSLIGLPARLAADGLDELEGVALVATFAVAARMEDQARALIGLAERLDAAAVTVSGWAGSGSHVAGRARDALTRLPGRRGAPPAG
jgi:hypothetical protein